MQNLRLGTIDLRKNPVSWSPKRKSCEQKIGQATRFYPPNGGRDAYPEIYKGLLSH